MSADHVCTYRFQQAPFPERRSKTPDRKETISFVRALSDVNSEEQAHVFEVSIDSKE